MKYALLPMLVALASCTSTVVKDRPVEVKVPVTLPCVKDVPKEVEPLRDRISKAEWDKLDTDQRQKLIVAQGLDRKAFSDKAIVVIAGCP